jgi:hypothetical protein
LRDNLVSRGSAVGVKQAVAVHGAFRLIGNQFSGFDEIESAVLTLYPDRFGKPCRSVYRDNFFTQCAVAVSESQPGLWDAASVSGNTVVGGTAPPNVTVVAAQAPITVQPLTVSPKPVLRAPALPAPVVVDGDVREWPWTDKTRAVVLEQSTLGDVLPTAPKSCAVAAVDTTHFYLAVRVTTSAGYKLQPATSPYSGDGMEVAFQSAEPQVLTPIFMCYGSANGSFWPHAAGGATAEQMALLEKETQYAVKEGQGEWTAEWRIPLAVLGKNSDAVRKLRFNIGVFHKSADLWVVWCGTGAEIYRVENAGEVIMAE